MPGSSSSNPNTQEPPGLYATIAARTRRAADATLATAAAVGIFGALGFIVWRPALWIYALPLVAVGSVGVWGIADREQGERTRARPNARRLLTALRWSAAGIGTAAVLLVLFAILGRLLGTIMS